MAQSGYDPAQEGETGEKVTGQEARQGQNVVGMVRVLVIATVVVVVAFGIMLALQNEPVTPANTPGDAAPASTEETVQSPS